MITRMRNGEQIHELSDDQLRSLLIAWGGPGGVSRESLDLFLDSYLRAFEEFKWLHPDIDRFRDQDGGK